MKAIETVYKGYRFRSRLEARWAVFFDALGVKWEYEKEGYDLDGAGWYLPDFWLSDWQMWVEVKGACHEDEVHKAFSLMQQGQNPVCIVFDFDHCILFKPTSDKKWCYDRPIWFLRPIPSEHQKIVDKCMTVANEIDALDKDDPLRDEWIAKLSNLEKERMDSIIALIDQLPWISMDDEDKAVSAARQARFEHGENGGFR